MFLPTKRAPYSNALNNFILIVREALFYSIETFMQTVDFDVLKSRLDCDLRCILDNPTIKKSIEEIFELPYLERSELCTVFNEDICFEQHIDDEQYSFHKISSDKARGALKRLCEVLYEQFDKRILQKKYAEENGELGRVCPVCVREILFDDGEGEIDHYFPRARYPALTLHPYNILPICSDCNGSRFKHTKNPIDAQDMGMGELQTVFLPYLRSARGEVDLRVSEDYSREIVILPKPEANQHTKKRIENMERLFKLGQRWSSVLSRVYDDLVAEISAANNTSSQKEEQLRHLRNLLLLHKDSTKNRADFIKGVYCGWLDTKSDETLMSIFLDVNLKIDTQTAD